MTGAGRTAAPVHLLIPIAPRAADFRGVRDKNALAILNSNLIPLPNAPYGCNFSLPNFNSAD